MKVIELQQGFILLSQAKLTGLTATEKYKVMSLSRELKTVAKDFEDFIKDTQEKIEDRKEQNEILSKEAEREVDVKFAKLEGEVFDKLLLANDEWNVSQATLMEDILK